MGSLLRDDFEEELVRLSLWDHSSARETPGKEKSKPRVVFCEGVSSWDEPCMIPAITHFERCNRWFCQIHFDGPDWQSCSAEEQGWVRSKWVLRQKAVTHYKRAPLWSRF